MSEEKKKCPGCAEAVPVEATVCEYCGERFSNSPKTEQTISTGKFELYDPKVAGIWSLLFTPIFGAYVIKNNWKILGKEQQEKRSKTWMIVLAVIFLIALLFLNEDFCGGLYLLAFVAWYLMECRQQVKYLAENRIGYQKKNWKSIAPKAAVILVGIWLIFIIVGTFFGGPSLDCSSNKAFMESGETIIKYIKDDIGAEELAEKAKFGDLTESEEEQIKRFYKLQMFFAIYKPNNLSKEIVQEIDGMSASELLDYIDEYYGLNQSGNWLSRSK